MSDLSSASSSRAIVAPDEACPDCGGSGMRMYAREVEDGCDLCNATGRIANASLTIAPDWTPTAENINALPDPVRRYIHDLETTCDPAGLQRELCIARDITRAQDVQISALRSQLQGVIATWKRRAQECRARESHSGLLSASIYFSTADEIASLLEGSPRAEAMTEVQQLRGMLVTLSEYATTETARAEAAELKLAALHLEIAQVAKDMRLEAMLDPAVSSSIVVAWADRLSAFTVVTGKE